MLNSTGRDLVVTAVSDPGETHSTAVHADRDSKCEGHIDRHRVEASLKGDLSFHTQK